jgi:demethylmenaquinone methyltransferase/2-methoxy-6-polyprenyl-1,4-benzoquinol methylase
MLERAALKGLAVVLADAAAVPIPDDSVDAAMLVSMLHHVPDWRDALAEARRVVRPGGVVAVMAYAREHLFVHGIEDYFPTTLAHFAGGHQTRDELLDALPGAHVSLVHHRDTVDGSLAALAGTPEQLLDADVRRQTSFFEWAERERPTETEDGLRRLADDLRAGRRPHERHTAARAEIGDAFVLTWTAPEAERPVPGPT